MYNILEYTSQNAPVYVCKEKRLLRLAMRKYKGEKSLLIKQTVTLQPERVTMNCFLIEKTDTFVMEMFKPII